MHDDNFNLLRLYAKQIFNQQKLKLYKIFIQRLFVYKHVQKYSSNTNRKRKKKYDRRTDRQTVIHSVVCLKIYEY